MSVRSVGYRSKYLRQFIAALGVAVIGIGSAQALELRIDGISISDNKERDLNKDEGVIVFDSEDANKGFKLRKTGAISTVKGELRVKTGPDGSLPMVLTLTKFKATRNADAGQRNVHIVFEHKTQKRFNEKIRATAKLTGTLDNPQGTLDGDRITWRPYMNSYQISDIVDYIHTPTDPVEQPLTIDTFHSYEQIIMRELKLWGILNVKLGQAGTVLDLPDSAELTADAYPEAQLTAFRLVLGLVVTLLALTLAVAFVRRRRVPDERVQGARARKE